MVNEIVVVLEEIIDGKYLDLIVLNLHRTLTLQRHMREPPLFRALIIYSSTSSGVTLLITKIHLSPSRVMLYLGPSDNSLVPLYLI